MKLRWHHRRAQRTTTRHAPNRSEYEARLRTNPFFFPVAWQRSPSQPGAKQAGLGFLMGLAEQVMLQGRARLPLELIEQNFISGQ